MFSLFYGLWKLLTRKSEFHILILGLDHAGKTSVLERVKALFTGIEALAPGKIPPTIGLNIGRVQVSQLNLVFWDVGGARSLRSLWESYFAEAHALLYVIDAADPTRFDESSDVLQRLLDTADLSGVPLLVLANKQDAPNAASPHEVALRFGVPEESDGEGGSRAQKLLGVTAHSGDGIDNGVRWLVERLKSSPRATPSARSV